MRLNSGKNRIQDAIHSGAVLFVCFLISAALLGTLPLAAAKDLQKTLDTVRQTDSKLPPGGLIEAGSGEMAGKQVLPDRQVPPKTSEIPLTTEQVEIIARNALSQVLTRYRLPFHAVTARHVAAYRSEGIAFARVEWFWTLSDGSVARVTTTIRELDLDTCLGELMGIVAENLLADGLLHPFVQSAIDAFSTKLNRPVPVSVAMTTYFSDVSAPFVTLQWIHEPAWDRTDSLAERLTEVYYARFENVDWQTGTGVLSSLELLYHSPRAYNKRLDPAFFAKDEQNAMLREAVAFAGRLGYDVMELLEIQPQLLGEQPGIEVVFETGKQQLLITVLADTTLLGFRVRGAP